MNYKSIIFDMDGTLADSLAGVALAINRVLDRFDLPKYSLSKYQSFIGGGIENLVSRVLPENPQLHDEFLASLRSEYSSTWKNDCQLYQGIPELLDILTSKGFRLSVLSNKPDVFLRQFSDYLLKSWHFYPVIGAGDKYQMKPAPDAALEIAGEWDTPPAEIIFVGDSGIDIKTARSAGMPSVGVSWGYRPRSELQQCGADYIIDKPHQLIQILDKSAD